MSGSEDAVWDDEQPVSFERDTKRRLDHLFKDGFRAGVAEGQEEKLQFGFDEGYETGMKAGMAWGTCQGILTTYQALQNHIDDSVIRQTLNITLADSESIEPAKAFAFNYTKMATSVEVELKSKEMSVFPETMEVDSEVAEKISRVEKAIQSCQI